MSIGQTTECLSHTTRGHGPQKKVPTASSAAAVRMQLPTKHASPRRLSEELKALLGHDADFNVEVHHNVYMIESNQDFDPQKLYFNCRHTRRDSNSTSSESD